MPHCLMLEDVNLVFPGYTVLPPNVREVCAVNKAKMNKYLPECMIEKIDMQSCLFRLRQCAAQCLRSLHNRKHENEQVPATLSDSKSR